MPAFARCAAFDNSRTATHHILSVSCRFTRLRGKKLVCSVLPTTTQQQHVVSAGVECSTELLLVQPPVDPWAPTAISDSSSSPDGAEAAGVASSSWFASTCTPGAESQDAAADLKDALLLQSQEHQQHQQQQVDDPVLEYHKNVVRSIRSCCSVQQLAEVLQEHGPQMDVMSTTACFTAAARLVTQQRQQQQQQQHQLDQPLRPQQLTQQSVQCNQQLRQLHEQQQQPFQYLQLQQQEQHTDMQQQAGSSSSSRISSSGLHQSQPDSQQQQQPGSMQEQLQAVLQQQLLPLLRQKQHQLDSTGLVLVMYSMAVLGIRDEALLVEMEQAAVPLVQQLAPRLLAQLVWALGVLGHPPQQQLLRQLLVYSCRRLAQANSQDCAHLVQGFARCSIRPPLQWMEVYYSRVAQLLAAGQLEPTSLCIVLHSLARLSLYPPYPLLQRLLAASQQLLPSLTPAGMNMLCNALHRLKLDPSPRWQQQYMAAAQAAMQQCDAWNVSVLAVPLLRWRVVPPAGWVMQYMQACEESLQDMQPQGLAVLGHSLAGLRVLPPQPWLLKFLAAADSCRLASTPAGSSYLLHTLGNWQAMSARQRAEQPSSSSAGAAGAAAEGSDVEASGEAVAAGSLGIAAEWLRSAAAKKRLAGAVAGSGQAAGSGKASAGTTAAALAEPGSHGLLPAAADMQQGSVAALTECLLQQCVQCFLATGSSFTPEQLGMLCKGLALLQLQGSPQLARKLNKVAHATLKTNSKSARSSSHSTPTAATLTNLLLALAVSCPAAATPQLMNRFWSVFSQPPLLQAATPAHVSAVAWAAGKLNVQMPAMQMQQMVTKVAVHADEASMQQLSVLLLEAAQAGWQLERQTVQLLVQEMLRKQQQVLQECSAGTAGAADAAAATKVAVQVTDFGPEQQVRAAELAGAGTGVQGSSCSSSWDCHSSKQQVATDYLEFRTHSSSSTGDLYSSSSGRSSSQAARLFGLANHRLKNCLAATAAAAAWADVLGPRARLQALKQCGQYVQQLDSSLLPATAVRVCCLVTGCTYAAGFSGSGSAGDWQQQQQQQQWLPLPPGLAAVLWRERESILLELSNKQQQVVIHCCLKAAGVRDSFV